jgi:acetyl esterase/lipase
MEKIEKRSIIVVTFVFFLMGLVMVPKAAVAQHHSAWFHRCDHSARFHRCDVQANRLADEVSKQLPPLPPVSSEWSVPPQPPLTAESVQWYRLAERVPYLEPADYRIYYGAYYLLFGDLRLPIGSGHGPYPVAIMIHGGSWQSYVNLDYMQPLAEALRCAGIATWNIEYRRIGVPGGGWPNTFLDVASAADFLRKLALLYPLDLSRVVTIGHSSGASLAMWLAARHRLPTDAELYTPNPLPIKGVVALGGGGSPPVTVAELSALMRQLLGGGTDAEIAPRIKEVYPVELLPLGVPQVFVNGEFDSWSSIPRLQTYISMATAKGDQVQLIVVEGGGHFDSPDPANPQVGPAIREAVLSFIR